MTLYWTNSFCNLWDHKNIAILIYLYYLLLKLKTMKNICIKNQIQLRLRFSKNEISIFFNYINANFNYIMSNFLLKTCILEKYNVESTGLYYKTPTLPREGLMPFEFFYKIIYI